jgi:hypothetical protein
MVDKDWDIWLDRQAPGIGLAPGLLFYMHYLSGDVQESFDLTPKIGAVILGSGSLTRLMTILCKYQPLP